jgi:DNA-binding response OmpR family regulator
MCDSGPERTPGRPVILVVDDDPGIRRLLTIGLPPRGFTVLTAGDGAEAVAVYRQEHARIDLALIDLQMPAADGREVIRRLRAVNPDVRCCLISGGYGMPSAAELHDLKVCDLILKPFNWADLAARLRECLTAPRTERRQHLRRAGSPVAVAVSPAGTVWCEGTPAQVMDRSLGGLRLSFPSEPPTSDQLRVRPTSHALAAAVEVAVRHRRPHDGNWQVGCQFMAAVNADQMAVFG